MFEIYIYIGGRFSFLDFNGSPSSFCEHFNVCRRAFALCVREGI